MIEELSGPARAVAIRAEQEARLLGHNYVGSEHLLLGVLGDGDNQIAQLLRRRGLTLEATRAELLRIIGAGDAAVAHRLPFTPRAKLVLRQAIAHASGLSSRQVASEHVLLALTSGHQGVLTRLLTNLDFDHQELHEELRAR